MPNTKSAKKRLKQSLIRRANNRAAKSAVKGQIRKVREAVAAGNLELAETELRVVAKRVDQAAAGNHIHDNAAGRVKSRLSALIRKAKAPK